ncbi:hypothetical protein F511_16392 [Dorcoceras hygrometricum]|uniref:Uncharacterized protein n=1 Tax=Dorcoceras hygrometricum TaxID=472368 RepID=A0A2Z7BGV5_9LAMI|nr:hypothetical protein F511_16392 [Dorcoceras hygrometricum]
MFEALVASGLNGFMGCMSDIFETLVEFYQNASVRDGRLISLVQRKSVEISEEVFSRTFQLPMEGLTDMNEVPKDIVFDARTEFSFTGEQLTTSCKKRHGDAWVYASQGIRYPNLYSVEERTKLGFWRFQGVPTSKILTARTIGRYISINDKISVEDVVDVGDVSRVKKTPVKRVVSKKRPATAAAELVVKKKRTLKGKASPSNVNLDLVSVAQEAVPLQIIEDTAQLETDMGDTDETVVGGPTIQSSDEFISGDFQLVTSEADRMIGVENDPDEERITDDESMTLEEILSTIPAGSSLPSTTGEVTKIQLGTSIQFRDVNEGDWYKASLPKISTAEKGKEPLYEKDPIKRNLTKEIFSLICADIDLLVKLREQVIDEVDRFFNSFSFKKLAALKLEEIYAKEELLLTWAETDSTKVALQRRSYILTKYRELLLRKFLETRKSNFVSGTPSSAIDLQFLDKLSDLHLFVLEVLKTQTQAHGLRWEKTCCSKIFEGKSRDRGAVIARSNTNTKSSCWIRTMVRVNDSWVIEPRADYWKLLPRQVVCNEVLPQFSYVDTLPTVSEFFKLLKKRWTDVCLEAAEFFVSGTLLPDPIIQMDIDQHPDSPPTSADSSLHFNANDIPTEEDSANDQLILPSTATPSTTDIAASFSQLRASIDQVKFEQIRVSMTFRVVRTNQYNQDLGLIHSTNGNHLESPDEGSSIDHQVTIYLHAQNITMFPTNETWTNQYNQDLGLIHSTNGNHLESPNEGSSIDHQITIYLHAQNITMFPTNETCASADFMKTSQLLNSNKGNAPAGFTITMQLLIFNEEVKLLILTRKEAPADE